MRTLTRPELATLKSLADLTARRAGGQAWAVFEPYYFSHYVRAGLSEELGLFLPDSDSLLERRVQTITCAVYQFTPEQYLKNQIGAARRLQRSVA